MDPAVLYYFSKSRKSVMKFSLTQTKRTSSLLIWILFYLSIIPMQLSEYVLCIGADGHVALEASTNGRCTDTHTFESEHVEPTITGTTPEEDHCGSCIDLAIFVPLNTQLYLVSTQRCINHFTASSFTLVTHQKRTSTIPSIINSQDTFSLINPTLVSLRTNILLI